jgi:hypothetical protein
MFFDLRFPSIDPWTDLEELLDPPEQADAGRASTSAGCSAQVSPHPLERRDGESVGGGAQRIACPGAAAAGR